MEKSLIEKFDGYKFFVFDNRAFDDEISIEKLDCYYIGISLQGLYRWESFFDSDLFDSDRKGRLKIKGVDVIC